MKKIRIIGLKLNKDKQEKIKRKIRSVKQNRKKFILANKFNKNQVFSEALRIINNFEINLKKDLKSKSYLKFLFFKLFYFQK